MQTYAKIVTHARNAHVDEFIACCLALAKHDDISLIQRAAEPRERDLENPLVHVFDTGGRYEPHNLNFDHHQSEDKHMCTLSLYLDHLGLLEQAMASFDWLRRVVESDNSGPASWCARNSVPGYVARQLNSPLEKAILVEFGSMEVVCKKNALFHVMKSFGKTWMEDLSLYRQRCDEYLTGLKEHVLPNGYIVLETPALSSEFRAVGAGILRKRPDCHKIMASVSPTPHGAHVYLFPREERDMLAPAFRAPATMVTASGHYIQFAGKSVEWAVQHTCRYFGQLPANKMVDPGWKA